MLQPLDIRGSILDDKYREGLGIAAPPTPAPAMRRVDLASRVASIARAGQVVINRGWAAFPLINSSRFCKLVDSCPSAIDVVLTLERF